MLVEECADLEVDCKLQLVDGIIEHHPCLYFLSPKREFFHRLKDYWAGEAQRRLGMGEEVAYLVNGSKFASRLVVDEPISTRDRSIFAEKVPRAPLSNRS